MQDWALRQGEGTGTLDAHGYGTVEQQIATKAEEPSVPSSEIVQKVETSGAY